MPLQGVRALGRTAKDRSPTPNSSAAAHLRSGAAVRRRRQGAGRRRASAACSGRRSDCSAAIWLAVHMTMPSAFTSTARQSPAEDFKRSPEGHTGGSSTWCRPTSAISLQRAHGNHPLLDHGPRPLRRCDRRGQPARRQHVAGARATRYGLSGRGPHALRHATSTPMRSAPTAGRLRRSAAMSMRTRPAESRRAAISASPNCNTCTCRCRAKASSRFSATARSRSSAAAIGRRAGGAPRIAASWRRS